VGYQLPAMVNAGAYPKPFMRDSIAMAGVITGAHHLSIGMQGRTC